ncbi:MAG TPA: cytochrome c [Telluria sp.]|nr:cytochrome c [Telluria sp.]
MKKLTVALIFGLVSINAFASGNVANGEALAKKYNCAACHGADFAKPIDPSYPKLAGQHADYLAHAMAAYKRGDSVNGRVNAIMSGQVAPLSGKDMKDIAAYLASLPSSVQLKH